MLGSAAPAMLRCDRGSVNAGLNSAPTSRRLGVLTSETLAIMHGPSIRGDCSGQLKSVAQDYEKRLVA